MHGTSVFGSLRHAGFELTGLAIALWVSLTPARLVLHRYGARRRGEPPTWRRVAWLIAIMTVFIVIAAAIEASLPTLSTEGAS